MILINTFICFDNVKYVDNNYNMDNANDVYNGYNSKQMQVVPILVPSSHTPNRFSKSCRSNQPDIRQINRTAMTFPSLYKMIQRNTYHECSKPRFFYANLSHVLINEVRQYNAEFSVQDIKAYFRGGKYVDEILKLLPQKPDPILIQQIFKEITTIGKINTD